MNPEVSGYTTPFPLTPSLSPRGEGWGEGAELTKNLETKRLKQNLNNLVALNLIQGLRHPSLSLFLGFMTENITLLISFAIIQIMRMLEKCQQLFIFLRISLTLCTTGGWE